MIEPKKRASETWLLFLAHVCTSFPHDHAAFVTGQITSNNGAATPAHCSTFQVLGAQVLTKMNVINLNTVLSLTPT